MKIKDAKIGMRVVSNARIYGFEWAGFHGVVEKLSDRYIYVLIDDTPRARHKAPDNDLHWSYDPESLDPEVAVFDLPEDV